MKINEGWLAELKLAALLPGGYSCIRHVAFSMAVLALPMLYLVPIFDPMF
jgi:hypothetical protein